MKKVCRVRLLELSPKGAGIVVKVDGREAFLPAQDAAEWIVELGYNVLEPIRISIGVTATEARLGAPQIVRWDDGDDGDEPAAAPAPPAELPSGFPDRAGLARMMMRYPMIRAFIMHMHQKMLKNDNG